MHIVLDLDETLISSQDFNVILRPNLKEFMEFCFSNFETVSIWSAAESSYVNRIASHILPTDKNFMFIYTRSQCKNIKTDSPQNEFSLNYKTCKPLSKMWRRSPARKIGMNKRNTIIIEDTPSNCVENYSNAIYIDEFNGQKTDRWLLDLMDYLKTDILNLKDVRSVEKRMWRILRCCF